MKKLLIVIIVLVVILGGAFGGAYAYASSIEDELALKGNVKVFSELKDLDSFSTDNTSEISLVIDVPGFLETPQESSQESRSTTTVDVEEDTATTDYEGSLSDVTVSLDEYMKTNIFGNQDLWFEEIDNGNFELNETDSIWTFKFSSEKISNSYIQTLEEGLKDGLEGFESSGLSLQDFRLTTNNVLDIVINIDKDSYEIIDAEVESPDEIRFDFDLLPDSEELKAQFEAGGLEKLEGNLVIERLFATQTLTSFELKDGKSIPSNPLILWIAVNQ